ncbi:MAG: hypothetical protein V4621_00230 [Pseudomonadota bacterium]
MFTHQFIWTAIDALAQKHGYSTSGLAKRAGLDSTTFNKSKRFTPEGKPRWPSTESISVILAATHATMSEFITLGEQAATANGQISALPRNHAQKGVPVIPLDKMHMTEAFDLNGYPLGDGWKMIDLPPLHGEGRNRLYGIRVVGTDYEPVYRAEDILLCQPFVKLRAGMRALLLRRDGALFLATIGDVKNDIIRFDALGSDAKSHAMPSSDFALTAQIQWVSQ